MLGGSRRCCRPWKPPNFPPLKRALYQRVLNVNSFVPESFKFVPRSRAYNRLVASLSLNPPPQQADAFDAGGVEAVLAAMETHADDRMVQGAGCAALQALASIQVSLSFSLYIYICVCMYVCMYVLYIYIYIYIYIHIYIYIYMI